MILQTEIANLKLQMSSVYDTLSTLQALLNSLASTKTLSNMNFTVNQHMGEIEGALELLDSRLTTVEGKVTALETQVSDIETRLEAAGI